MGNGMVFLFLGCSRHTVGHFVACVVAVALCGVPLSLHSQKVVSSAGSLPTFWERLYLPSNP